jgi:hypothetical protein
MDLMGLLQGQLSETVLNQLSQQIGGDKEQTSSAANGIIQTLLGGLAHNANNGGAEAIANTLDQHHSDGGILGNLAGLIGGQTSQSGAGNGLGILQHILGDKTNVAANMIGQNSGLSGGQVGSLMQILAPMVMSQLGQAKQQNGLDAGGISSLLTNVVSNIGGGAAQQNAGGGMMGMISSFLDKDGDGSAIDEIGGMLMNQLFNRK